MPREGWGPAVKHGSEGRKDRKLGNLTTPEKIQRLQNILYEKAKSEPNFRFYSLYDKICRPDVLEFAYRCAKANGGSPGIDGETFQMVEERGRDAWLGDLTKELEEKTYVPGPVLRIFIPKPNGKLRPLGIPNLKDRVVQTAAVIVLGSIFEADLPDEQYAYRDGKNAIMAVEQVKRLLNKDRHFQVVDADLSGYFDTIPHPELIKSLARRISDGKVLHLLKAWLETPVVEKDKETGTIKISTYNRDNRVGTLQGNSISPLFSNIYMRRFINSWKDKQYDKLYGGQIVNYADDLVICCKRDAKGAVTLQ
jgi:group II intron reverse transcriptase/maturase